MDLPVTFKMQLDERKNTTQFTNTAGASFLQGKFIDSGQFAVYHDPELTKPCFTTKGVEKSGAKVAVGVYDGADGSLLGSVKLMGRSWRLASTWKLFDANNREALTIQQDVGFIEFWIRFVFTTMTRNYRVLNTAGQQMGQVQQMWVRSHVPGLQFNCPESVRSAGELRLLYAAALLIARYDVETMTFF